MADGTISRRDFIKHTAILTTGAVFTNAVKNRAIGAPAQGPIIGANERINIGIIGCGGMGNAHIRTLLRLKERGVNVDIVAVCDIYTKRLDAAAKRADARPYKDYRRLLEDKDIDAVCIATPDHWHAQMTIDAAEAGKDIYCEKPMTYWADLSLPKRVVETIARTNRVMQVGTQGMSDDIWDKAGERIKAGALGKLIHAQASDMRNGYIGVYDCSGRNIDPSAKPGVTLDWEMFLGSAPKRPWEPARYFAFRSFWDYSGGICTDFFPHILTPLIYTMGLTFPKRVTASGGLYYWKDGREVPDIFNMLIEYPDGPSVLLVASIANDTRLPWLIRGNEATLHFEGPGAVIRPQRRMAPAKQEEQVHRTHGASLEAHWMDFLNCIKTRKKPRSNELLGYYVMTALHMAVRSYREGRVFEFDAEREEVL